MELWKKRGMDEEANIFALYLSSLRVTILKPHMTKAVKSIIKPTSQSIYIRIYNGIKFTCFVQRLISLRVVCMQSMPEDGIMQVHVSLCYAHSNKF